MMYYFGSKDQVLGDIEYNKHNFTVALNYYKNGLNILNQIKAQSTFNPSRAFCDSFAYVLTDVIICASDELRASLDGRLDYNSIKKSWVEISSYLSELNDAYKELQELYAGTETNQERMQLVYNSLAMAAEAVSDRLNDWLELRSQPKEKQFTIALTWLERAKTYKVQAGVTIETEVHLGSLNLLEGAYNCEKNKELLTQITKYIEKNSLHELPLSNEEKLELLSYELLVVVENNETGAQGLIEQARALIDNFDEMDEDSKVITDVRNLIARVSAMGDSDVVALESIPGKKRSRSRVIEDDEEEVSISATASDNLVDEPRTKIKKMEVSVIESEESTISLHDEASLMRTDEAVEHLLFHVQTNTNSRFVVPEILSHTIPKQTSLLSGIRSAFFATPEAVPHSSLGAQKDNHKAFRKTMEEISVNYNDPKFLANLLSIIADFYHKNNDFPFKNLPITAYSIYETVLKLNPQHGVALTRIQEISSGPAARMIRDNQHFAGPSAAPSSQSAQDIFFNAIKENICEIETYLSTRPEELDPFFDRLLHFVADTIKQKNIAGSLSVFLADLIETKYAGLVLSPTVMGLSNSSCTL